MLHTITSKDLVDPSMLNESVEPSTQPLKQGDTVVVVIDDPDLAHIVVSSCGVTLNTAEYTIDGFIDRNGASMAFISNGKPISEPIGIECLRRVSELFFYK